jgi:hypothetical protein
VRNGREGGGSRLMGERIKWLDLVCVRDCVCREREGGGVGGTVEVRATRQGGRVVLEDALGGGDSH